ncbi:zinc metallopeptidase [bacterium]|nr:zinc metallopeptidase [bacterium]
MFFFDWTFILLIPVLILSFWAQHKVSSTFARYSKIRSSSGLTGREAAERIISAYSLGNIKIRSIGGTLTDHFDPRRNELALSEPVYNSPSVAAIGVAAHETGHAIQYARGYLPVKIRGAIVPIAGFGSNLAIPLFIFGFIFGLPSLVKTGIILFSFAVILHLVTLPVELDASRRALIALRETGSVSEGEIAGVRKVLTAAAMTYVAATLMAVAQLIRLVLISRRT